MRSREDRRTIIVARSHLAESQGHLLWAPWLSDQAMRRNYLLAFDGRRGTGVREHFFHFLWGYLLPAAHDIIELQSDCLSHPLENEFIFVSCGPVMDTKTAELAGYAPEGGRAERRTYGTSRRSLLGIEEAAVALSRQSHRVAVFEPGRHTLAEQIRTFRNCKGIIAIRGAELANIVWMNPTSKVIVINAGKFHLSAPPAWGLAKLLGIRYIEIDWGEDPYPRLGNELVQRISNHLAS